MPSLLESFLLLFFNSSKSVGKSCCGIDIFLNVTNRDTNFGSNQISIEVSNNILNVKKNEALLELV